jgi:hypothetical protein
MAITAKIAPVTSVAWFVVTHWMLGSIAGALCASILLILDIGRLRTLLERTEFMGPGLILLFGGFMLTFASVVCATALMQLSDTLPPG